MDDLAAMMATGSFGIAGLCLTSAAALKAWNGWLDLRRSELGAGDARSPSPAARIEMADMKERVRKLEAIADGVQL